MDVQTLTFIFVGVTFALYLGIAIWSRAGSTDEFYVAGGGVSPLANGMATAADWMSAASFISMAGIISFVGRDGSVYLMGWTGGYVLLALLLAPYLRIYRAGFRRRPILFRPGACGRCHLHPFCFLHLCGRTNARSRHRVLPLPRS